MSGFVNVLDKTVYDLDGLQVVVLLLFIKQLPKNPIHDLLQLILLMGIQESDLMKKGHKCDFIGQGFIKELTVNINQRICLMEL